MLLPQIAASGRNPARQVAFLLQFLQEEASESAPAAILPNFRVQIQQDQVHQPSLVRVPNGAELHCSDLSLLRKVTAPSRTLNYTFGTGTLSSELKLAILRRRCELRRGSIPSIPSTSGGQITREQPETSLDILSARRDCILTVGAGSQFCQSTWSGEFGRR